MDRDVGVPARVRGGDLHRGAEPALVVGQGDGNTQDVAITTQDWIDGCETLEIGISIPEGETGRKPMRGLRRSVFEREHE